MYCVVVMSRAPYDPSKTLYSTLGVFTSIANVEQALIQAARRPDCTGTLVINANNLKTLAQQDPATMPEVDVEFFTTLRQYSRLIELSYTRPFQ